jgi:uncharacterized protein (DUF1800 family)
MPATIPSAADPAWAWAAYVPDAQRPWNLRWAGHLCRRSGFGATWQQLQQALADGPRRTVDKLLRPTADVAAFNRTYDEHEAATIDSDSVAATRLREWWLRRMIETPHPLLETMVLFWHNHFAISAARVGNELAMQRHVQLLRTHALGRFQPLLAGLVRDPAVLLGLNGGTNRQSQPNAGFARNLMEAVGLLPDHCPEDDVRAVARAFTGWFVLRHETRYLAHEHDPGVKRILGQSGNFSGEDVVRIVLQQSAAPRLVVRKLYRWLISETDQPSDALLAPLAEAFGKDYDIARLVETVLRSNLFFSPAAYRQRVKSPVEFALGIIRGMEAMVPTQPLAHDLGELGQTLGQPPTTHGWAGGRSWINRFTLVGRNNLAVALLAESGPYGGKLNPTEITARHGASSPDAAARLLIDLYTQGNLPDGVRQTVLKTAAESGEPAQNLRRAAHLLVTLPEFQLG